MMRQFFLSPTRSTRQIHRTCQGFTLLAPARSRVVLGPMLVLEWKLEYDLANVHDGGGFLLGDHTVLGLE